MVLGEVVSEVVAAFAPMDDVLVLGDAVFNPIKTHVTLSEAKYLAITGSVAFVPPLNPPLQPEQAVGATGPQITEANRMHLELKQTFNTYPAVNQGLRNFILAAVPPVYVNSLSHDITGFGNVSALTIMTSLWERYGTITQAELAEKISPA